MITKEADALKRHVDNMTFKQLCLLWRWITLEVGHRVTTGKWKILIMNGHSLAVDAAIELHNSAIAAARGKG